LPKNPLLLFLLLSNRELRSMTVKLPNPDVAKVEDAAASRRPRVKL
jgi:hypothetical protein